MTTKATAHKRPTKRTRTRLSKAANAATTIDGFAHDTDVAGLTYGQFSLIDLIEATLAITGPGHVTISTWSAGFYDVDAAIRFRDSGKLLSCRFVMDSSAKRGQATVGDVAEIFGQDNVRATRTHTKFATIINDGWSVLITSSMNLNLNPRCEQFEMTDDKDRARLFLDFADALWAELPPGDTEDRKLPTLHQLDAVDPTPGLQVTKTIQMGPSKWAN